MFSLNDRIKETTASTGVGNAVLAGAASGFQSFSGGIGSGNTCNYTIVHQDITTYAEWEVGLGTVDGSSLIRNQVYQSSNSNALVSFSVGTKDAFVTYPATGAVYYQSGDFIPIRTGSAPADTSNRLYNVGGTLYWDSVDVTGGHQAVLAASSSDNSGRTYIQDLLFDSFGHVTGVATATETVADTNTTYTANTGLTLVGTEFNTSGTGVFDKLGIGTDSPTYLLDVAGNAGFDEYIYHNGDTDTFIRLEPDEINIQAGGEKMIFIVEGGGGAQADKVTINDDLADIDFQVKGGTDPNLIRTDAANNRVGIGTGTPTHLLDVAGDIGVDEFIYHNDDGGSENTYIKFENDTVNLVAGGWSAIKLEKSTGKIQLNNTNRNLDVQMMSTGGDVILHTDAELGRVGIGTTTPSYAIDVSGTGNFSGGVRFPDGNVQIIAYTGHSGVSPVAADSDNSSTTFIQDLFFDSFGHVTGVGTATAGGGGGGAPTDAQYVTLALDGDLSAERTLVVGTGLQITDAGANGNVTIDASGYTVTAGSGLSNGGTAGLGSSVELDVSVGGISNNMLAGSIANGKLANSSVNYGGITLSLGGSDTTPAFDLADATNYPTSSLVGTITNAQLAGSIANAKLANSAVTITAGTGLTNGGSVSLGGSITVDGILATTSVTGVTSLTNTIADNATKALTPKAVYDAGYLTAAAPDDAQYVTLALDGDLSAERTLAVGTGLQITDAGANGNVTIDASGYTVTAGSGLSNGGFANLGGSITVDSVSGTTSVMGAVKLTNTVANVAYNALTPKAVYDAGYLTAHPAVSAASSSDNSGSTFIQDLTFDSFGHVTAIATASAGGGGGAPTDAQYVTLALDGDLSAERVLVAGTGLQITDAGANGNVTIDASGTGTMSSFIVSDGSTTQTIENGNTLTFSNVANETTVAVSSTDTVTVGLPTKVNIDASYAAFGTSSSIDLDTSNLHNITLSSSPTLSISNATVGQRFIVRLIQDSTGGRTVTWFSTVNFHEGVTPSLTPAGNKVDVFGFICTTAGGSPKFDGFTIGKNISV